jgi:hypothetical protein
VIQSDTDIKKSKQKLGCKIYFSLSNITKQTTELIHKEAIKILKRKRNIMDKTLLYETIVENLKTKEKLSLTYIDSVLDLFNDIVF